MRCGRDAGGLRIDRCRGSDLDSDDSNSTVDMVRAVLHDRKNERAMAMIQETGTRLGLERQRHATLKTDHTKKW